MIVTDSLIHLLKSAIHGDAVYSRQELCEGLVTCQLAWQM